MRPDGGDAIAHLIAAQNRSTTDPVLQATREFFNALGEQLVIENSSDGVWRAMLHPMEFPTVPVNVCDTGEGYTQVLPVLVALARARQDGPRLLCLEQPELHLHTRAQASLAQSLVQTATSSTEPKILVETHSEVLPTSVQLAIVKGEIPAESVRVYWVESRLDGKSEAVPVDFDSQGRPTGTALMSAFEEAFNLGQELISKQLSTAR
ncbi:AAA family ATPase [Caballeronia sp. EK]|uniref:AAA family ATPase n=1 Tax=Caballeronia sp. EK TaxID=2767469 RepID=UPI00165606CF|nr:AAA family ATPase [Caballeronia sp. EK]MBC8641972.1 AAA family ATPase [Caballeronia sp. EK]